MDQIVVDSNVLIAYLVESDEFHQRSQNHINGLENGDYTFHLPMLVMVEVVATLNRSPQKNRLAILNAWQQTISDWERSGKVVFYPLDRNRMEFAINFTKQRRLRGADSVIAGLADELGMPLKTFDKEILARYLQASI
jgi:predicted nucleic acid-binding protein